MLVIHPPVARSSSIARWLFLFALLLAACGGLAPTPVNIVVGQVATATGLATITKPPESEQTFTPTATTTPRASTPTISGLRTKTPVPGGTSTPTATATRRRGGGGAATATATPAPPSANGGSLDTRAHGVTGTLRMENTERVYKPGEQLWFRWTLSNVTAAELKYGHIGVLLSTGEFHTSWSGSFLKAMSNANWRDWVSFAAPGEYTLVLAICLSPAAECEGGGQWVNLTAPLSVSVR